MRSLRDPLLDAELNPKRKSSLWHFAAEIMVRVSFLSLFPGESSKVRYDFGVTLQPLHCCPSADASCSGRASPRAPSFPLPEEAQRERQRSIQGIHRLPGFPTVCAAHNHRQLPCRVQVRGNFEVISLPADPTASLRLHWLQPCVCASVQHGTRRSAAQQVWQQECILWIFTPPHPKTNLQYMYISFKQQKGVTRTQRNGESGPALNPDRPGLFTPPQHLSHGLSCVTIRSCTKKAWRTSQTTAFPWAYWN